MRRPRVVKDLTRKLVGNGHHIYLDNYFNSVELQQDLRNEQIYACIIIRRTHKDLPVGMREDRQLKEWNTTAPLVTMASCL